VDTRPTLTAASSGDEIEAVSPDQPALPSDLELEDDFNPADDYRALCTPAVASIVLGLLSTVALLDWWLVLIPFGALLLGIVALRKIRNQPREYTGKPIAILGIALALVFGAAGLARQSYEYATELPPGFARISYSELQPQEGERPDTVPPDAMSLDGKKVLIKGYVYPGQRMQGITEFLLVRDQGSCCFGGNPKITDRIQVSLSDKQGFTFGNGVFKVAGVFHVTPPTRAIDAGGAVFYHLDEAMLR
jgi:hypothetical protein